MMYCSFSVFLFCLSLTKLSVLLFFLVHTTPTHTHLAHTPDNSFMGFVSEELNETEKRSIQQNKVNNMAVVYGKEASMWKVVYCVEYNIYAHIYAALCRSLKPTAAFLSQQSFNDHPFLFLCLFIKTQPEITENMFSKKVFYQL